MLLWLWEILTEFAGAVARGDKSWWPPLLASLLALASVLLTMVWLT